MNKSQKIVFRIFYILLIASLLLCFWGAVGQYAEINYALACLAICTFVPVLYRIKKKHFNLFEPLYAYIGIFSVFYIFSSIYVYNRNEILVTSMNSDIYNLNHMLPIFYILSISILCFHLGYCYCLKNTQIKLNKNIIKSPQSIKLKRIILFLYTISIIFRIIGYLTGSMGSLSSINGTSFNFPGVSILYFITNIWYVYFAYITVKFFSENQLKKTWLFCLIFEILIVLISGDRRYIIQLAIIVFTVYYFIKREFPWKLIGLLSFIFAFIFVPITTMYGYYLETNSSSLAGNIELFSFVFSKLGEMSIVDILSDYIIKPIAESLFIIIPSEIAYAKYDLQGEHWGPVGLYNLFNNIFPSGLFGRIDTRYYYEIFTYNALSYNVDYSPLTFQFTTENILSYGLCFLPICYFINGIFIAYVYKTLFKFQSLDFVLYIALFFALCYSTHFGLLTTELITPIRVLIYYLIIKKIFKNRSIFLNENTIHIPK